MKLKFTTITKTAGQAYPLTFIDTLATPQLSSFEYYTKVFDSCGNEVLLSNSLETIHLSAANIDINQNYLEWNAFTGWDSSVEMYYIYRMIDNVEPTTPVDSVDGFTLEYTDDLSYLSNTSVIPVYWVEAVQEMADNNQPKVRSRSNRTSVAKDAEMFVPTAFRPGGYNPTFKPVFKFYNGRNYLFQIYNRWGQLVFETNDPGNGWEGTYQGKMVQPGTFVYRLVYQNLDGSSTIKTEYLLLFIKAC